MTLGLDDLKTSLMLVAYVTYVEVAYVDVAYVVIRA